MKLFIGSVLFFLSLAVGPIDAADNSSGQPKKRGGLKKLLSRKKAVEHQPVLSSIAESSRHVPVADGGLDLDHKHNEDAGAESTGASSALGQNTQVASVEVVDAGSGDKGGFFSRIRNKKNAQDAQSLQSPAAAVSSASSQPGELTTFPTIRASHVHPMWLSTSNHVEQPSPKTPKSRQQLTINPAGASTSTFAQAEDDECDTQFVQASPINTFFKHFMSKLLPYERKEYEGLYSLKATSSLKAQSKSDYKAFCRAQTVLRRAVAVAYGLTSEQNEKCRQDMTRCHSELADGRKALEQEKSAFSATMAQQKQEIVSQVEQARTTFEHERNAWNQQVAQDKITAKRRTYALLFACAISLSGIGLTWASLRNKSVQATAA